MREMKNSGVEWIGEIPAEWELNEIFQVVEQVKNKNVHLVEKNLLSLSYGKIKRKDIENNEGLLPASFDSYNVIEKDDIVLRLTDLQNDHKSLRVGLSKERGIITSAYVTLRPNEHIVPLYLYYLLYSFDIIKGFYGMGAGVRQSLKYDEVKTIKISSPDIYEQHRIASYLDKKCSNIDAIITKNEQIIEKLKEYKSSLITETVTKGLNPDVEMKNSGIDWIGEIPAEWKIKRLKMIFGFGKGLPITKENLVETGIPVISYGQIHAKFNPGTKITDDLIRFVPENYVSSNPESLVHKGDILVADTSEDIEGCGNSVYVDKDVMLFAGYHTIILKSFNNGNKYLAYLFKTDAWRSQIRSQVSGVKLFSITKRILSSVTVILPPIHEQIAIASYLDEKCSIIDSNIANRELINAKLAEYKKSLIYEVVTGKKEII